MQIKSICKFFAYAFCLIPFFANAAIINLASIMTPGAEVPPVNAPGASGSAAMVLDSDTGQFSWVIGFEGLSGPATAAHFHEAAVGMTGDVVLDLDTDPGVTFSALGQTSGSFSGGTILDPNSIDDILADQWYINIHTEANPAGEIRGQVLAGDFSPVPLPAAVWMFLPAALGLVGFSIKPSSRS